MLYDSNKFLLVAGPCALESKEICVEVCESLVELREKYPELTILFSGSYDKANRTSLKGDRGPGIDVGLDLLQVIKSEYKFPLSTDIHLPDQAAKVGAVCDVLQIPAFLSRQTDLIVAAAETGQVVSVKKGQFMSPPEMEYVVQKLKGSNAKEIWLIERGNSFGYQNLVVDMRAIPQMNALGYPAIFDATHSVQLPGAGGGKSSGQRQFVEHLAYAACAAGAKGLYIEVHPKPETAISDSATQLPIPDFKRIVDKCLCIHKVMKEDSVVTD